ncbi:hypothetical protein [Flavobacterium limi]|uniref:Anti-bacteriophage protein A/HamA C-terminal domain-containing protein n=1 Tax=Flavobacterium limi TaxID=2045105 RepID=A0ABQ1UBY5_9FLAO|nr:hypothetical protein [Flavobacterium limi]GGF14366.1 hypothetical protein GCM10011518_24610 [Flavobacterium limi]
MNATIKKLKCGNDLCIIDIENIDTALKTSLDNKFIKICEGNVTVDLNGVKQRVVNYLTPKKGRTLEMGAIAEFFIHLYLNEEGFEPQFLFFNLEENSIKKGFDGYYFHDKEEWILESKSGMSTTAGVSHGSKVKESYNDLKEKLAGNTPNNPWREAYNHASHIDVGANSNVRANIKKFTVEFDTKVYHKINDFNIIPGSTIFLNGTWTATDTAALETEIENTISKFDFKKIKIVCVTKKSLQLFWQYLTTP